MLGLGGRSLAFLIVLGCGASSAGEDAGAAMDSAPPNDASTDPTIEAPLDAMEDSRSAEDASIDAGPEDASFDAAADGGACVAADEPGPDVVVTDRGSIRGVALSDVRVFSNVPYAAPPLGDLRFRPPVELGCFEGTYDATDLTARVCPQWVADEVAGTEDCLVLTAYAPVGDAPPDGWPVLVFLHGGGHERGSPADHDARALAARGAVVFVPSFRLGTLGFLTAEALSDRVDGASGNYGIHDQRAALEWVRRHAGAFGGDRRRLLLFGQSTGGLDVLVHMASPLSRNLFTRAAAMSPSGLLVTRATAEAQSRVRSDAVCPDAADVAACLRNASVESLVAPIMAARTLTPHVDGWLLPGFALSRFEAGEAARVPILIGATREEAAGDLRAPPAAADNTTLTEALVARYGDATAILALYPETGYASANDRLVAIVSDEAFVCPVRRWTRALSDGMRSAIHHYEFARAPWHAPELGPFHGSDLDYVFGRVGSGAAAEDVTLAELMSGMFVSFADTGVPDVVPAWPRYRPGDQTLVLDTTVTVAAGLHEQTCNYWDSR